MIDLLGGVFTEIPALANLFAKEDLFFFLTIGQWSQFITHTPFADHLSGHRRGSFDVVACACGYFVKD